MGKGIKKQYRLPVAIVLLLVGVFLIFDSYSPGHSWGGGSRMRSGSVGSSINPYEATLGVGLILCSAYWYRKRDDD